MCARGRKARWAAACRHLRASVVGYAMLGTVQTRDLPALVVILAGAVFDRVMESWWCRLAVMAVGTALASWLVVGG